MVDASSFTRGEVTGPATYQGEWTHDQWCGRGELRTDDGLVRYTGHFRASVRHGSGVMRRRESRGAAWEVYDGQWSVGRRHGQGRCIYADGSVYEGDWLHGRPNGWGELREPDGALYAGKWVGGLRSGEGRAVARGPANARRETYTGRFEADRRHGHGRCEWPSGEVYVGFWRNGVRHGTGRIVTANGDEFSGGWSEDHQQGEGTFRAASGEDTYTGAWVGGVRCGHGEWRSRSCHYVGQWSDNQRHGEGTETDKHGVYIGDFVRGERHGRGRCVYSDGSVYEGEWSASRRHGQGTCRFPPASALTFFRGEGDAGAGGTASKEDGAAAGRAAETAVAIYVGEWRDDERSGLGRYEGAPEPWGRGEKYDGDWLHGAPHGRGRCEYNDGDTFEGLWIEGVRQGDGALARQRRERTTRLGEAPGGLSATSGAAGSRPASAPVGAASPAAGGGAGRTFSARPATVQGARR